MKPKSAFEQVMENNNNKGMSTTKRAAKVK